MDRGREGFGGNEQIKEQITAEKVFQERAPDTWEIAT